MEILKTHRISPLMVLAGAVILFVLVRTFSFSAVVAYEEVTLWARPSASQFVTFGDWHLSAQSGLYALDRAQYLYERAATMDPSLPYVYHQLGRIAFLRGNFPIALFYANKQISLHGDALPNAYYMRGLIEGYMGTYAEAASDYEHYLKFNPQNWAAINDYAWVLLKLERFEEAAIATETGLSYFPTNAWLLNSRAIALYELGRYDQALPRAKAAVEASGKLTEAEWLVAYPGNDPKVAREGIATLQDSARTNMHMIEAALAPGTVQ